MGRKSTIQVNGLKTPIYLWLTTLHLAIPDHNLIASDRTRIRVFTFEEMRYYNFESEISLREVQREAEAIRQVLIRCLGKDGYHKAGSGLIHPPLPSGALTAADG